ncbi:hypothetical protein AUJ95_00170 [Candidatus Desantisbacteria bacterium CG2_30_40_21]|uniref:DUF4258 domain-containing protein n=5 Tax=unclassified Candidatus Desantisiibacteriota TaxID=3106372 RepID=A0A2M7JD64_9BACT|nr:MAG: hypothetical protein AUJ95_00170 [Candidatus Desantisbacteria bacterium CG2_30_40_21]PIP40372.1 MAG: hypothetical protein COX18_06935 [Candidatus Desantisbacteria bacterium CG23_combo_of_CG06-09_8_20_14_all_40_23]PIX17317.1 MAG: hypothetical protein COZ71_03930 [Candidatus Desantisbacteria bacterium CG_4_8_14_3_um_filter_40_12]PIY20288.1 MAG: hypothetical protein COZ13_01205 [Candidatus Desantisbacteria bacterium CG_4_10_14_3_um_filter_40_18]PJB28405.1 MAG: hypothetical protein CO110_09
MKTCHRIVLFFLILCLLIPTSCSLEDAKVIIVAKRNAVNAAREHPDAKSARVIAVKRIKKSTDAQKFLKNKGWYYPVGRVHPGDIMVVVKVCFRGEFFGSIVVYVCDAGGRVRR